MTQEQTKENLRRLDVPLVPRFLIAEALGHEPDWPLPYEEVLRRLGEVPTVLPVLVLRELFNLLE